tara:strand:+ start:5804 stop:6148 length:345 start_codon:yes stop_codon:yes gene_type:complete
MTPWKKGEFKKEVREMRERLKKMNEEEEEMNDWSSDEEQIISHYDIKCEDCETIIENFYLNNPFGNGDRHCSECSEKKMTKADWIKYHSEELLEGLVQSGKVIWEMGGERIVRE